MKGGQREPDKVIRAGGREFRLYQEYDEGARAYNLIYPEFAERPEYTAGGRPFSTAEREGCPHYRSEAPDKPGSDDCGGCGWFYREEAFAIIGVCMCGALRREQKKEEEEK